MNAQDIIQELKLEALVPEGGYYYRSYVSDDTHSIQTPDGKRPITSCIYYLIDAKSFSKLHRLRSDEIYHFYLGSAVELITIDSLGTVIKQNLGTDILNSERPQITVPRNTWQGLRLKDRNSDSFALLGTTVSPAFNLNDFEMAEREQLCKLLPKHIELIKEFT